ncbi:MAG: membrane integrity-associated transporter subunit PqiC [Deltaproteobacteria bacterium]|nr:membrane integrity-associated transporter subunit PqiC [Deltaproteobacteria bacterium]
MRAIALASTLLLIACGGSAPARTQYLLRSQTPEGSVRVDLPARIGLGRVVVAPYLDQSGIVMETAVNEVTPARNHTWAEPLDDATLIFLRAELSTALGEEVGFDPSDRSLWKYTVEVFIEQLHGTMAGQAVLVASYRIAPRGGAAPSGYRFSRSAPLASEGYSGLVDAEAGLLRDLASAIAGSIREQP